MSCIEEVEYDSESVCGICYEDNKIFDGVSNVSDETKCYHFFCTGCLYDMCERGMKVCPMCRSGDFGDFLKNCYSPVSSCRESFGDEEEEYDRDYYYDTDEE